MLGDPNANAWVGGCGSHHRLHHQPSPTWRKRFTAAWGKAIEFINDNPAEARKHLVKNTFTPDDIVDTVPMIGYFMAKDLNAKRHGRFSAFIDFSVKIGTLAKKVDVSKFLSSVLMPQTWPHAWTP